MKTEIEKSLPNCPNEWLAILKQPVEGLEKHPAHYRCANHPVAENCCQCHEIWEIRQLSIFTRALQDDVFQHYKPRRLPPAPKGYFEEYALYKSLDDKFKPQGWQKIIERYSGFLKAKEEAESVNKSNLLFLCEMMEFFKIRNMPKQAETCRLRMNEYEN